METLAIILGILLILSYVWTIVRLVNIISIWKQAYKTMEKTNEYQRQTIENQKAIIENYKEILSKGVKPLAN